MRSDRATKARVATKAAAEKAAALREKLKLDLRDRAVDLVTLWGAKTRQSIQSAPFPGKSKIGTPHPHVLSEIGLRTTG